LKDHRATGRVAAEIDAAPIAAVQGIVRGERGLAYRSGERLGNPRGALEDIERMTGRVPEPLRFVAVDRRGSWGQRVEAHADNGQTPCLISIAENRNPELTAPGVGLAEHRLSLGCPGIGGLGGELGRGGAHALAPDPPPPAPAR